MADTIKNTYTLYFYKTSKDSNNKMDFKTNLSMSFGSNSYAVSLIGLKYTKKVYEPCEILVTLSVAASSSQLPTNKEISDTFLNQKVSLEIGSNEVASNYFVYKVKPIFNTTSSASVTVELTIFSADKLMTLDKYSRAYTAKRLYTDILKPELQNFQMIDGTTLDTLVENHTQMLKYKVNESVSGSSDNSSEVTYNDELRIPYIVQYNESFYQFLVRAANRYGEFLYFENGKLNFGMQPSEKNYCDSNDVVIDWSSSSSGVQSRYYESVLSENIAVEDHAYNYKEHEKSDFEDLFASSSGKRHNFDAVPADEWTKQHLKKSFYRTQKDLWQEEIQTAIVELVFKALGTSTLGEFLTSLALETLKKGYDILMYGINCNYTMRKANYAPIKDNADQISGSNYSQFATYDGSSNLGLNLQKLGTTDSITNFTEDFYPLIRNKEKEVGEQAVWLEFGSNFKPIKLGDKLKVVDKDYVVIYVDGSCENNTETLLVKAVPVVELSAQAVDKTVNAASKNPSWTNTLPVPPALPDVLIRDARPQVAFVVETTDPEYLGRIRVRYPWQDKDGDLSPWIRVTLPLATSGGAVNFTPSEGDEVMVGYVHGNIDHPYGMGYLTAPFVTHRWENSLPFDHWGEEHGIKVKTGHHLLFTDGPNGASMIANMCGPLACLKSFFPVGFWYETSPNLCDLAGGFELSDRYGFYKIKGCTDERSVSIESPMGTVELNAFQGITISAPNGDVNITGKNVTISANNTLNITSGKTIKDRFYYQNQWEDKNRSQKAKAFFASMGKDAFDTLKAETLEKFFDMSFFRCVLEVLLRPVDGTLQIKSYTFISIEAGAGTAEIPMDDSFETAKDPFFGRTKVYLADAVVVSAAKYLSMIKPKTDALINDIHQKYDALCDAVATFNSISGKKGLNKNTTVVSFADILNCAKGNNVFDQNNYHWENNNLNNEPVVDLGENPSKREKRDHDNSIARNTQRNEKRATVSNTVITLISAARNLKLAASQVKDMNNNDFSRDNHADVQKIVGFIKALDLVNVGNDGSMVDLNVMKDCTYTNKISKASDGFWKDQKKAFARYVAYQYISGIDQQTLAHNSTVTFASAEDTLDNTNWGRFALGIEGPDLDDKAYKMNKVQRFFLHEWNPLSGLYRGIWDHTGIWKNGYKGKILLSEENNKTFVLNENGAIQAKDNRRSNAQNIVVIQNTIKKM